MPIRARLCTTHATAVSAVTTCARTTFDTRNYIPGHVRTRLHTCTPPLVRSLSGTAPRVAPAWRQWPQTLPEAAVRPCTASTPGPTATSRSEWPARGRPSSTRHHRLPSFVTKEEEAPLSASCDAPLHTGCSNAGETKSCEGWCCGSEGCGIEVRDMLRGQGVQKSELWAAGVGFANRCEQAGEG